MENNFKCTMEFVAVPRCDTYPAFDPKEHVINSLEELEMLLKASKGQVVVMTPETLFAWMEQHTVDEENAE